MTLEKAFEIVDQGLVKKQNPDYVTFKKQWNEWGQLKGWWVTCEWEGEDPNASKSVCFDITKYCTRMIGNMNEIPDFIPGKHQTV